LLYMMLLPGYALIAACARKIAGSCRNTARRGV
jgi:uncharacterized membrane protein YjjP (DUF1212 family)